VKKFSRIKAFLKKKKVLPTWLFVLIVVTLIITSLSIGLLLIVGTYKIFGMVGSLILWVLLGIGYIFFPTPMYPDN